MKCNECPHDDGCTVPCRPMPELYCDFCDKSDGDFSEGCLKPKVFSPAVGDWVCCILSTETGDNSQ